MLRRHFNCPRCNRRLTTTGVAVVGDRGAKSSRSFSADECIDPWELEPGKVIPCPLTFAVDPQGRPLDPDTGEAM